MKDSEELSTGLMDTRFREWTEAAAYIVKLQIQFNNRGYDREKERWWGNQDDEAHARTWSIETDEDDLMIAEVFRDRPIDASGWQAVTKGSSHKQMPAGRRAQETDAVARDIIASDKNKTTAKTARLKAQREAAEAAASKQAEKPKRRK